MMQRALIPSVMAFMVIILVLIAVNKKRNAPTPGAVRVGWLTNIDEAKKLAAEKKVPLLVEFSAEWCQPCHEIEREVFAHEDFRKRLASIVAVNIDVTDETKENAAILDSYGVTGLPTMLIYDREGKLGPNSRIEGAIGRVDFLRILDTL